MSEESSPPKKVGSLRDRIAQFEQKPTQPVAQVARTSAPQKNWAWKQKQAEVSSNPAPPPPAAASTSAPRPPTPPSDKEGDASTKASGMSASDARSSISQGGSLKERMAALQGRGAFGAPSSNAPPPPPPDGKPRVWKKAVVPHIPAAEPNSEEQQADAANITDSHPAEETEETREGDESVDPEEEERQRRANIAARMARLGGARVGMGPPVFSKKPAVVRRESEPENDGSSVKSVPIAIADPGPARKASLEAAAAVELPRSPPEHEEPSIHEELNRETRSLASPPSSPKRPRPPVPRSRSTSPASKPPVKETHRSQVISQGSSFCVPRSVYDYPSFPSPLVALATGDHSLPNRLAVSSKYKANLPLESPPTPSQSLAPPIARSRTSPLPNPLHRLSRSDPDLPSSLYMADSQISSYYYSSGHSRFYEPRSLADGDDFTNVDSKPRHAPTLSHSRYPSSIPSQYSPSTTLPSYYVDSPSSLERSSSVRSRYPTELPTPPPFHSFRAKRAGNAPVPTAFEKVDEIDEMDGSESHREHTSSEIAGENGVAYNVHVSLGPDSRSLHSVSSLPNISGPNPLSSFYPRPLSRHPRLMVQPQRNDHGSPSPLYPGPRNNAPRFWFFRRPLFPSLPKPFSFRARKKNDKLTEPSFLVSSPAPPTPLGLPSLANMTPAARIKSRYQYKMRLEQMGNTTERPPSVISVAPSRALPPVPPAEISIDSDDESPMKPHVRRYASSVNHVKLSRSNSNSSGRSLGHLLSRRNGRNGTPSPPPKPFATRTVAITPPLSKSSLHSDDDSSLRSFRSQSPVQPPPLPIAKTTPLNQLHTLLPPNHLPASSTLKHGRNSTPFPLPRPPEFEWFNVGYNDAESGDEEERGRRGVEEDPGAFAMEEEADDEAAGETYSTDPKRGRSNSSKLKAEGRSERQGTEDSETFSNAPPPVPKSTRPASPQFLPPPVPSKEGMNRLAGPKRAAPPRKKKVVQSPAGNEAELETEKTPAIDPAIITDEIPEGERSASKDIVTGDDDHTRLSDDENKREPDSVAHKQTLATSIDKDDDETAAGQPADLGYDGHDNANKLDRGLKQGDSIYHTDLDKNLATGAHLTRHDELSHEEVVRGSAGHAVSSTAAITSKPKPKPAGGPKPRPPVPKTSRLSGASFSSVQRTTSPPPITAPRPLPPQATSGPLPVSRAPSHPELEADPVREVPSSALRRQSQPPASKRSLPPPSLPSKATAPPQDSYEYEDFGFVNDPMDHEHIYSAAGAQHSNSAHQETGESKRAKLLFRAPPAPPVVPPILVEGELGAAEVMADTDTDPIDPMFYSPARSPVPLPSSPPLPENVHETKMAAEETLEDPEQVRKRTIAERMAKLGGIKFGAPMGAMAPPARKPTLPSGATKPAERHHQEEFHDGNEEEPEQAQSTEKERRAAIAARLAASGGMRIGMLPSRSVPPPPPPKHSGNWTESTHSTSLESSGAHAQHNEGYGHRVDDDSAALRFDEANSEEQSHHLPVGRQASDRDQQSSFASTIHTSYPSDHAMLSNSSLGLELSEPSPAFSSHHTEPPKRSLPPVTPPADHTWESTSITAPRSTEIYEEQEMEPEREWEQEQEPELESYEEVTVQEEVMVVAPPEPPKPEAPLKQLSEPELKALWSRIGTKVYKAASILVAESALGLIGDGTPGGFVKEAISKVPGARQIVMSADSGKYGHLIYSQVSTMVTENIAEMLPGDIIALYDVRLKGTKGLQKYDMHIGTQGGPLLGIVCELEHKKSKVKVYQAALHSNTFPSIETTSYRLDDLKSGKIQIYRVGET